MSTTRRLLAALCVTASAFVLTARAAPTPPPVPPVENKNKLKTTDDVDPKAKIEEAASQQERLRRQFEEFKQALLRLKQRLESSPKQEDKDKARVLQEALAKASEQGTDTKFTTLVGALKGSEVFKDLDQLQLILDKNEDLRKDIRMLIELLLKDDRDAQLKRDREEYTRMLERLKEVIAKQEKARTQTELARKTGQELEKIQKKVTEETKGLLGKNDPKSNQGGEAKKADAKGQGKDNKEGKPGEGKNDTKDAKGDTKNTDGKEGKPSEGKESKEGKPSEGKEGKPSEGKEGKPSEGKPSEGKEGKPSEGKEGKPGEGKEGKPGESKEGKPSEGKEGKPGEGKEGKPSESKPGAPKEAKPNEGKPGDPKPGDPKGAQNKPEPKSGSDSKGKSEGKGDPKDDKSGEGKPGDPKGEKKPGESKDSKGGQPGQQSQSKPGGGQSGGGQPPPPNPNQPKPQDNNPAKKQIEDGQKFQQEAEKKLNEDKKPDAVTKQDKALEELKKAQKKLEELLKQLREEEIERLLAALQGRCERMLAMQIAVRDGTVALDKFIDKKEPTREQQQNSNVLSDKEEEIVREASKAISIIQAEGTAVAFAEVFIQVRGDMTNVAARLRKTDTGVVTQTIENDIIATLQEMIEALKKARKDNQNKPPPPKPGQGGPPPDPKLIDMIAELKMIRSMQLRVNARTEVYGKQYEGEQVPPPAAAADDKDREHYEMIRRELRELGDRQQKIEKVTSDIAKGKNKAN